MVANATTRPQRLKTGVGQRPNYFDSELTVSFHVQIYVRLAFEFVTEVTYQSIAVAATLFAAG
ncbi:MAG: hypothetical protein ACI9G1_005242 [Pirellulaceae bacterium]